MVHQQYVAIKPQERDEVKRQVGARFGKDPTCANSVVSGILQVGTNTGSSSIMLSALKFVCSISDNEAAKNVALQLGTISDYAKSSKFMDACVSTLLKVKASNPSLLSLYAKAFSELAHHDKTHSDPDTAAAKVDGIVQRNLADRKAIDDLTRERRKSPTY